MEKLTTVIVRFQLEGIHRWKDAEEKEPEVDFLSFPHRHMFHFEVSKLVEHDDRDIEIILFKRSIMEYLLDKYGAPCRFENMSCEMIAEETLKEFDCTSVQVMEDNENGAKVTKML